MSWQDKVREEMYFQESLRARDAADLDRRIANVDRNIESADRFVNGVSNFFNGIGRQPSPPPPPPKTSSGGGGLGLLVAGAAVAGGAYLLSKVFGGSDDKKSSTTSSNTANDTKKDANAYLSSGNDYYNKRQYELAIKDYTKAILLNPDSATAYYNRGNAYQALGGNTANAKSDFARAKQLGYYG